VKKPGVLFSDCNATRKDAVTSPNPNVVRFDLVKARNQFAVPVEVRHFYQAELLVPSPVPPELIPFPTVNRNGKQVDRSVPAMKPMEASNATKKVESDVIMKVEAANELESKLSIMKPEAVKVEEVQCSMSIMKPEACNDASKKENSVNITKHSHNQAMNVVVLGSTHKNTTPHRKNKPSGEVEEAEEEAKVRRVDCQAAVELSVWAAGHNTGFEGWRGLGFTFAAASFITSVLPAMWSIFPPSDNSLGLRHTRFL